VQTINTNASLPVAPVLSTPTVTDTTIALAWTISNDTGVTDYIIEYKASSSGTWLVFADGTSSAKTATITGLLSKTSYDTRVKAINSAGTGSASNVQTISTNASLPVAPVLGTPAVTDTTIALTWTMSSDTGVTDYIIEYKASSSGTWLVFSDGTSTTKTTIITGLSASTSYDTRVKAVNTDGTGSASNVQTISTKRLMTFADLGAICYRSFLSGVTTVSGAVSAWVDLTGTQPDVVQTTATRRPLLASDGISFDGVDDILTNNNPFLYALSDGFHSIMIFSSPDISTTSKRALTESDITASANSRFQIYCKGNTAGNYNKVTQEARDAVGNTFLTYGQYTGATPVFNNTFKSVDYFVSPTQIKTAVNSVDEASPISYTRGSLTLNRHTIGALGTSASSSTNAIPMVLKVIAVFPPTTDSTVISQRQGVVHHNLGVQSLLPAGHPFKTNPPLV
jgi:hypothetical protein